ncbi:MAG: exo-beta-N-acetylmuramidase NamZ domain-containing protein, partial [Gemmatimonadales bacterium]
MHRRLAVLQVMWCAALGAGCGTAPAVATPQQAEVRPGLEVLLTDSLALVAGRRAGLVANMASVDRQGVSGVDRLRAGGVNLAALFSPEHGFRGTAAPGERVASSVDSATGLPIYSLYGRTVAPTPDMLAGIEVLLVDLPDVGARYYTYISTTVEVMRAAGRAGIPVVVLDRPNPIGGRAQGNVLDSAFRSFVGMLSVPMRPGLTLGEQALLARSELGIAVDLRIVPAANWTRNMALDDAGLPFLPPSPNLKDLESLFHYPGTCLFEGTALSVGRGTSHPFHQVGAPWLDTTAVLALLRSAGLPGVRFVADTFTPVSPGDQKHAGTRVHGIRLVMTDRSTYDPTLTAVAMLVAVQ